MRTFSARLITGESVGNAQLKSVIIKIVSKVILTVNFGFGGNRFFIVPPHITLHKLCIPLKLLGEKDLTHCN